jgi:NADPH:quinone reductase-like Zn-dependent oxidoreductase
MGVGAAPARVGMGAMKAVVYKRYGTPDVLRLADVPTPKPRDTEVLVRELLWGKPLYSRWAGPFRPRNRVLGSDIAGQVEATGGDATRFRPGDDVFADILSQQLGTGERPHPDAHRHERGQEAPPPCRPARYGAPRADGELCQERRITTVIDRRYPLSEVPGALRYLGEGHAKGKVVVIVD